MPGISVFTMDDARAYPTRESATAMLRGVIARGQDIHLAIRPCDGDYSWPAYWSRYATSVEVRDAFGTVVRVVRDPLPNVVPARVAAQTINAIA